MFNQRFLIVGISCCLVLGTTGTEAFAQPQPFQLALSNLRPAALQLTVVSRSTQRLIANRSVTVNSHNGVRCVTAPCPTNIKKWQGQTNRQGIVWIPQKVVQQSTTIKIPGYAIKDLGQALQSQSGIAQIELSPVKQ
jgi:hypothetical protein